MKNRIFGNLQLKCCSCSEGVNLSNSKPFDRKANFFGEKIDSESKMSDLNVEGAIQVFPVNLKFEFPLIDFYTFIIKEF